MSSSFSFSLSLVTLTTPRELANNNKRSHFQPSLDDGGGATLPPSKFPRLLLLLRCTPTNSASSAAPSPHSDLCSWRRRQQQQTIRDSSSYTYITPPAVPPPPPIDKVQCARGGHHGRQEKVNFCDCRRRDVEKLITAGIWA